jgi:hypothetical protein
VIAPQLRLAWLDPVRTKLKYAAQPPTTTLESLRLSLFCFVTSFVQPPEVTSTANNKARSLRKPFGS